MNTTRYITFCLILISFFGLATGALASRLYFEAQRPENLSVNEFLINLNIETDKPINALAVGVNVPDGFVVSDTNNGNSIISLWLEEPLWDENSRLLKFSGIIPGGFSGQDARLLTIKFSAPDPAKKAFLKFNPDYTQVLLHSPDGERDELALAEMQIPPLRQKQITPPPADNTPPETFAPAIAQDPEIFAGRQFLVFSAQDKGSGLSHYEVAEKRGGETSDYKKLDWRRAESPYLLSDQKLRSFIYAKAIDKSGNERVMVLQPQKEPPFYTNLLAFAIIIAVTAVALAGYNSWKKKTKKQKTKNYQ